LQKAHAADYAKSAPGIDAYLSRSYIGSYNTEEFASVNEADR
jgi:hypothetical protein